MFRQTATGKVESFEAWQERKEMPKDEAMCLKTVSYESKVWKINTSRKNG